jgi:hypothetical protein
MMISSKYQETYHMKLIKMIPVMKKIDKFQKFLYGNPEKLHRKTKLT